MASRSNIYEKKNQSKDIEDLSNKLTADLRKCIRALGNFPVFTEQWYKMAESLGRIAAITEMEQKLPKAQADATLWECEELALRYILEDGKLNLCLRLLIEFKENERQSKNKEINTERDIHAIQFEKGLGIILKNAWLHVEALQTTELALLLDYIQDILHDCIANTSKYTKESIANKQEVIVLYYLYGILKRIDDIGETRIMPVILEKKIFPLLAHHLYLNHTLLTEQDIRAGCCVLSMICDTEDFQTHKNDYIQSEEEHKVMDSLKEEILESLAKDYENRRQIRALLDFTSN